jgi:flagellar hook-associated protein 3 FlgL
MASEATYVDIGLGMEERVDGEGDAYLVHDTAYNSAISGIGMLGYGKDEDGYPKNLAVLMKRLGTIFSNADPDTGAYSNDPARNAAIEQEATELTGKLLSAIKSVQDNHIRLDAETQYIRSNQEQLKSTRLEINIQIEEIEQEDPAESITAMMWAQYSYNAALKIGTDILSQSLLDYMK